MLREIDGEYFVLNIPKQLYYGLDPIGTRMLQLILDMGSTDGVVETLADEYDAERDILRRDLSVLLEQLAGEGIIELHV
jgi:hypothetical protein